MYQYSTSHNSTFLATASALVTGSFTEVLPTVPAFVVIKLVFVRHPLLKKITGNSSVYTLQPYRTHVQYNKHKNQAGVKYSTQLHSVCIL